MIQIDQPISPEFMARINIKLIIYWPLVLENRETLSVHNLKLVRLASAESFGRKDEDKTDQGPPSRPQGDEQCRAAPQGLDRLGRRWSRGEAVEVA